MGKLDWKHHTLIQALMSRGPLLETDVHAIFAGLTGENPGRGQKQFNDYLLCINKELAYVQLELRGCRNQYDGNVYYGVVNNVADEQSKLATKYSAAQIALYKAIVDSIVQDQSAQGTISSIEALNVNLQIQIEQGSQGGSSQVPTTIKHFSMSQREKTIQDLVHDKWLCFPSSGIVGLGLRSFLDLRSWFHSNDIPRCEICNEAGVKASLCSRVDCLIRIHDYCLKKKFAQKNADRVCPGCGAKWNCPDLNMEDMEEAENGVTQKPKITNSAKRSTRKRRSDCQIEVDINFTLQTSQSNSESTSTVRRSKRIRLS